MNVSLDEFYDDHRPRCYAQMFERKKSIDKKLRAYFRKRQSFVLISERSGMGKHETIRNIVTDTVELVSVNDEWSVENVTHRDESSMDMETFMCTCTRDKGKEVVFIVEESVLHSKSSQAMLSMLLRCRRMCVYMFTSGRTQTMNPTVKRISKQLGGRVIVMSSVPKKIMVDYFNEIGREYDVNVSKRACKSLVDRTYGNIRVFLRSMYMILDRSKHRSLRYVTTPVVLEVLKTCYMDGFNHFIDVYDRCNDKELFTFEERSELCNTSSYAYHSYCYRSITNNAIHPQTHRSLDLNDMTKLTELFSFSDIIAQEHSNALLLFI